MLPALLEHTACGGKGCGVCGGEGRFEIDRCPLKIVPPDYWFAIRLAEAYARHGIPPRAGGYLDQAADFVQACHVIWNDDAAWRNRKPNGK